MQGQGYLPNTFQTLYRTLGSIYLMFLNRYNSHPKMAAAWQFIFPPPHLKSRTGRHAPHAGFLQPIDAAESSHCTVRASISAPDGRDVAPIPFFSHQTDSSSNYKTTDVKGEFTDGRTDNCRLLWLATGN